MSRSLGPLYSLVSGFSLTQLASGLASIFVYELDDARDSQFIAILYALATFYMVYMLIPHTTHRDSDPVSRLNKQFVIVNFLLLCWALSVGLVPLTVSSDIKPTIARCASTSFFSPLCITLALDMTLPFALIAVLTTISWRIYKTAQALQSRYDSAASSHAQSAPASESALDQPNADPESGLQSPLLAPSPTPTFVPYKLRPAPRYVQRHGSTSASTSPVAVAAEQTA